MTKTWFFAKPSKNKNFGSWDSNLAIQFGEMPRLILNLNMFYNTVKCIRKKFLKSRKIFAPWVLMPLKTPIMAIWLFLRSNKICQPPGGGYTYTKNFYSWNLVTLTFKEHICNFIHFDDPYCTPHKIILENKSLFKNANRDQKWQLKVCKNRN